MSRTWFHSARVRSTKGRIGPPDAGVGEPLSTLPSRVTVRSNAAVTWLGSDMLHTSLWARTP